MKQMTCKQMGGSCNTILKGKTAEEMFANGTMHFAAMSKKDDRHKKNKRVLDNALRNPDNAKKWMTEFEVKFAQLTANIPL